MAVVRTEHVKMSGIAVTLPEKKISIFDLGKDNFPEDEIRKISKGVGVQYLYEAKADQTAADFCLNSAEKLISDLGWEKATIDGLIFATQTPDYIAPSTAPILQNKLGLPVDCLTYDINFGCTGFLNGLLLASHLIELKTCKRVLVLVGDTLRRLSSELDKGLHFILSDAGSAVAFEYTEESRPMITTMHSDGAGYDGLIVPAGGARLPKSEETKVLKEAEEGNFRSEEHYYMNGMDIFSFAIRRVPAVLNEIMELANISEENVSKFFLHQANAYMVKYITKRAKIGMKKCPINIDKFGNTNGSTIPLLLSDYYNENKNADKTNVILCAFGVGLSWGATSLSLDDVTVSEIQYI